MNLFKKLSQNGVLPRQEVRNELAHVRRWQRLGYVKKVFRKGRVYFELTEKALPLLETYRQGLLAKAQVEAQLNPQSNQLKALLHDLRFLDPKSKVAKKYQLLGDWQLCYPVQANHLKLAKLRFYERFP